MKPSLKLAIGGFVFGTLGMFVFAMLSLILPFAEALFGPLFWPGRALSGLLFGAEGSDGAVAFLMVCNGLLYAMIFVLIGKAVVAAKNATS